MHSILNHDLAKRVAMLGFAGLGFKEPGITSHLKQDEASLGTTTLWSRELLLIGEHNLPRFKLLNVAIESRWLGLRSMSLGQPPSRSGLARM